jgi:hypothetical protein
MNEYPAYNDLTTGSSIKKYFILFALWPFLALIIALMNYNQKESRKVVYLFLVYYGLTFFVGQNSMDSARYALELKTISILPFSDFFKIVGGLYTHDNSVDIYEPLVSFIVSRFTSDHRLLFGVFAAVFGFFYLKSVNLLYHLYKERPSLNTLIHLIFFAMIIPITTINGVRMWTAAWIFFYGAYFVIIERNPWYILIALSSSLVHWSFMSVCIVLIIYYLAGNRNFIYLPLAAISFVLPRLLSPLYKAASLQMGSAIKQRYSGYTSKGHILEIQNASEQTAWFVDTSNNLIFYYVIAIMLFIYYGHKNSTKTQTEKNIFSFSLLLLAFVNFGKPIPSFGNRFQIVFLLFATLYVFYYFLRLPSNRIKLLTWIGLFPMLLYAAVQFRIGSETISAWLFTPGFGLPWLVPGVSLASLFFH